MKNVIITGATGVLGVSLINELISNGINITVVCRVNSKRVNVIPKNKLVKIIECNLDKLSELKNTLTKDYDVFYHFAWDGTFGSDRQNLELQMENIKYTLDAVKLAKEIGCNTFIGAGSQSEFGHVNGVLKPSMACFPDNGYGGAKLSAGIMSRIYCEQLQLRHIWCRILSMYGPFDSMNTMVMSTIKKMLNKEEAKFTKGEQVWDYIYSKDAAKAFMLLGEKGKDKSIYCIGSGKTRLLKEYIECIRDNIDSSISLEMGAIDYYPNQVMHMQADTTNLKTDLEFEPKYTFEDGIKETIKWMEEYYEKS